jgi:glycerophosphoryl diester phosphodiesterase
MPTRRNFLSLAACSLLPAFADQANRYHLIAHRGGLVDDSHAENSVASIEGAIQRGYWMLEVDVRMTKDGEPILQHDPDFRRYYNDPRKVSEMTWNDISRLRSNPGNTSPIHFHKLCEICKGKISLMLDIKGEDFPAGFYQSLKDALSTNQLLNSVYLLGGSERAKAAFGAAGRRPCNQKSLPALVAKDSDIKSQYYLFELAADLTEASLDLARKADINAVAAINTFRYTMTKRDEQKGAEEDAARMKKLGVSYFQIDSRYDSLFL